MKSCGQQFYLGQLYAGALTGLLSYSQSTDPASPFFNGQSQRYSDKNYRQLFFTDEDINSNLLTGGTTELTGVRVQKQ